MNKDIYIIIGIAALLILLGLIFFLKKKNDRGKKRAPNYKALFIIGISWLPIGIATNNHTFTAMGTVFMIVGAANRKKWKENDQKWRELSPQRKKLMVILLIGLAVSLLLGLMSYYLFVK